MVFAKSEKRCNSKVNGGSIGREEGGKEAGSKDNQRISAFCLICLPCFPSRISFRWAAVAQDFLDIGKYHFLAQQ